jgi:two-component system, OmpR family, phosphate regulon sensor histidine kinase PhoR
MKREPWELVRQAREVLGRAGADCSCDRGMMEELVRITGELDDALSGDEPTAAEVMRILGHELKSPVAAIVSLLSAVEVGHVKNPGNTLKMVARARKRAEELLPLVTDVMELGSLSAADPSSFDESVSMLSVCMGVHDLLELMFQEKGISFELSVPPDSPYLAVRGRESFLRRVVQNLCVNAFKYNRPGGSITLRLFQEDPFVVVQVSDTGVGIPEADLPHVFSFLYRGRQAKRNPDGGLGLGLSMVKQIVEVHGGTISAESTEGEGTVMTVRLPLCRGCAG